MGDLEAERKTEKRGEYERVVDWWEDSSKWELVSEVEKLLLNLN